MIAIHRDAFDSYHKTRLIAPRTAITQLSHSYHRDAFDSYHRDSLETYAHSKFDSYPIGCVCAVSTCASAVFMHQHVCNGAAQCCGLSSKTTELSSPPPSAPNKARNPTTPPRPRDHELVRATQMRYAAQPHLPAHKIRSTCSTQHRKGEIINWRWHRGIYTYRGCYRERERKVAIKRE